MDKAYMVLIYIDSDDDARQTNMAASRETDEATLAAFESYRRLEVDRDKAAFLLDLHDAEGDLIDTILLDAAGFTEITGEQPKTDAVYRAIDALYWAEACAEYDASRTAA